MPKAYSNDLHQRVTDTVSSGASLHEAAELFDIAVNTAVEWMQRLRDPGSSEAKPRGGSVSRLEERTAEILAVVEERPDAILDEIVAVLRKQGIVISRSAAFPGTPQHHSQEEEPACCRATPQGRGASTPQMDPRSQGVFAQASRACRPWGLSRNPLLPSVA